MVGGIKAKNFVIHFRDCNQARGNQNTIVHRFILVLLTENEFCLKTCEKNTFLFIQANFTFFCFFDIR